MNRLLHFLLALLIAVATFDSAVGSSAFSSGGPHSRIYLYAHANPVNNVDPSGNLTLNEMMMVSTAWVAARLPFVLPTLYVAKRAAEKINIVSLANAFRSLYFGVGNQIARIPNCATGVHFERMLNPAMRLLQGVKGTSIQAMYNGAMRTAKPDWLVWGKNIVEAKLGQAIEVSGQQFQVYLSWAAQRGGTMTYITLNMPPDTVRTAAINAGNAVGVTVNFWSILPW